MSAPTDAGTLLADDPSAPSSSAAVPFRALIPDASHPKIAGISEHSAASWAQSREAIAAPAWLMERLRAANLERPFKGMSTDGVPRPEVYTVPSDGDGDAATTAAAATAARTLLSALTPAQRAAALHPSVRQDEIRLWSNPELYVNAGGVRLDEAGAAAQDAAHGLLRATLSPAGYDKVRGCCVTNGFLGELVGGQAVLNRHSYNLRLFGAVPGADTEDTNAPWAFTFFGHHLCLCALLLGPHVVIAPTFLGAEPDRVDDGPDEGLRLFRAEELAGLTLQQALPPHLQRRAVIASQLTPHDPLPPGGIPLPAERWNPFDERHLGGARQDNRVLPYEGVCVADMPDECRELVVAIWTAFNEYYPAKILQAREREFRKTLHQTHWAWIGGWADDDAFYYRIHGPIAFCELDFHCGIFLTNTRPARCHVHTVNRLPNAGDYGQALLQAVREAEGKADKKKADPL